MELTVHITYFPMEDKYGVSLWQGDSMIYIDYQLYSTKQKARKMGEVLKKQFHQQEKGDQK